MSIKLRFQKGSYVTVVTLADAALPAIHELIATHQTEDEQPSSPMRIEPRIDQPTVEDLADPSKQDVRIGEARSWLAQHSPAEALSKMGWETFPEKILVLGALHQAQGGEEGWRNSDIDARFRQARETPPANFSRDLSQAIKGGIIATVTPRTYKVSNTGWLKIYDRMINDAIPVRFKSGSHFPPVEFNTDGMPET